MLSPRRALLAGSILFATALAPRIARADDQTDLDKIRAAYLAHQYDEAERKLIAILDPDKGAHDPAVLTQARMYLGAVMLAKGNSDGAGQVFEKLILEDPTYEPDPLSFPTNAIDLFIDTRARLRERLNAEAEARVRREAERRARDAEKKRKDAERLAMLEKMAGEEKVTEPHSRWIALLPFGVGQFQNGERALGWTFFGTETALLASTLVCLPIYLVDLQYRTEAHAQGDDFRAREYVDRANTVRTVDLALAGAFAVVAVSGIVQAQLSFVPEKVEVKKRAIPSVGWQPVVGPGFVGAVGTF